MHVVHVYTDVCNTYTCSYKNIKLLEVYTTKNNWEKIKAGPLL